MRRAPTPGEGSRGEALLGAGEKSTMQRKLPGRADWCREARRQKGGGAGAAEWGQPEDRKVFQTPALGCEGHSKRTKIPPGTMHK